MDARIIKTEKKIKEALFFILQTKKIYEVSITEICKRAKINRNTFYAHFASPEAVLDAIAEDYLSDEYKVLENHTKTKDIVITACRYIKSHSNENLILLSNTTEKAFIEKGVTYSKNAPFYTIDNRDKRVSPKRFKMIHTYIINGAVAIIKEWLYSGMKESPEEIGEMVDYITTSLIRGINQSSTI